MVAQRYEQVEVLQDRCLAVRQSRRAVTPAPTGFLDGVISVLVVAWA